MTSVVRWVEVHRLAVAGREAGIARVVGGRVGEVWLARSRFADVARLAGLTLTLGEDALALCQLGWAKNATGNPAAALEYYGQALPIQREVGDRAGEAVTRYNVAMIHRAQGELGRAVAELERVVELDRQVGHPDLQSDTEMLHRVRQELAGSDPGRRSR